jgi:VWFA-related protein
VRWNGEPLAVDDPRRIAIPHHDPRRPHFLTAVLTFPDGTTARADLAWGGSLAEAVSAQNTALPVEVDRRRAVRDVAAAADLVTAGGAPARVVAVERGGADLVVVRERSAIPELAALRLQLEARLRTDLDAHDSGLEAGDRLFVVGTTPETARPGRRRYDLFPATPPQPGERGGIGWQLTHLVTAPPPPGPQQIADAVATAGLLAAGGARPRAVLLLLGPEADDASLHDPREVRRLLARLRVPLRVWYLARDLVALPPGERAAAEDAASRRRRLDGLRAAWGPITVLAGVVGIDVASRALRRELGRQRIVWVDGQHLPDELALTREASGVRLAGVTDVGSEAGGAALAGEGANEGEVDAGEDEAVATLARAEVVGGEARPTAAAAPSSDATTPGREPPLTAGPPPLEPLPATDAASSTTDSPAPAGAGTATFAETVEVELVEVTVVAVDRRGEPVVDLGRDDFEVLDGGEPVEIASFARVEPVAEGGSPEPEPTAAGEPARIAAAVAPPILSLVLYFDDVSLEPAARARALRALGPFVETRLAAGARLLAAVWDGALTVVLPFTDRPPEVAAALEAVGERFATGGNRVYADRLVHRRALDALEATLVALAGVPGRKALLYVGGGIPFVPAGDLIRMAADDAGVESGQTTKSEWIAELWSRDAAARFAEILARANAAGITVHTLDAAGVRDARGVEASVDRFDAPEAEYQPLRDQMAVDPLQYMAAATGGRAIVNANRFERPLAHLGDELAAYYSLAYRPPEEGRGEYRTIDVRVRRPGVRLRHRRGYRAQGPAERLAARVVSALYYPPDPAAANPLAAEVALGPAVARDGGTLRLPVAITLPVAGLALLPSDSGRHGRLTLAVAAIDPDGDRSPVARARVPIDLPADDGGGGRGATYTVRTEIALGARSHRVAVGVRDELGGLESVIVMAAPGR